MTDRKGAHAPGIPQDDTFFNRADAERLDRASDVLLALAKENMESDGLVFADLALGAVALAAMAERRREGVGFLELRESSHD